MRNNYLSDPVVKLVIRNSKNKIIKEIPIKASTKASNLDNSYFEHKRDDNIET
ncbi:hypothetical protein [Apilactobacillus timberlakei]|uniref:hypothetical protein n=1 Tax=Apilactobacillus timberlakei TaxID=2008380 RepID=UPI0012FFD2FE|nr:hypothetical protein [Apilactobacillus timberlakei]